MEFTTLHGAEDSADLVVVLRLSFWDERTACEFSYEHHWDRKSEIELVVPPLFTGFRKSLLFYDGRDGTQVSPSVVPSDHKYEPEASTTKACSKTDTLREEEEPSPRPRTSDRRQGSSTLRGNLIDAEVGSALRRRVSSQERSTLARERESPARRTASSRDYAARSESHRKQLWPVHEPTGFSPSRKRPAHTSNSYHEHKQHALFGKIDAEAPIVQGYGAEMASPHDHVGFHHVNRRLNEGSEQVAGRTSRRRNAGDLTFGEEQGREYVRDFLGAPGAGLSSEPIARDLRQRLSRASSSEIDERDESPAGSYAHVRKPAALFGPAQTPSPRRPECVTKNADEDTDGRTPKRVPFRQGSESSWNLAPAFIFLRPWRVFLQTAPRRALQLISARLLPSSDLAAASAQPSTIVEYQDHFSFLPVGQSSHVLEFPGSESLPALLVLLRVRRTEVLQRPRLVPVPLPPATLRKLDDLRAFDLELRFFCQQKLRPFCEREHLFTALAFHSSTSQLLGQPGTTGLTAARSKMSILSSPRTYSTPPRSKDTSLPPPLEHEQRAWPGAGPQRATPPIAYTRRLQSSSTTPVVARTSAHHPGSLFKPSGKSSQSFLLEPSPTPFRGSHHGGAPVLPRTISNRSIVSDATTSLVGATPGSSFRRGTPLVSHSTTPTRDGNNPSGAHPFSVSGASSVWLGIQQASTSDHALGSTSYSVSMLSLEHCIADTRLASWVSTGSHATRLGCIPAKRLPCVWLCDPSGELLRTRYALAGGSATSEALHTLPMKAANAQGRAPISQGTLFLYAGGMASIRISLLCICCCTALHALEIFSWMQELWIMFFMLMLRLAPEMLWRPVSVLSRPAAAAKLPTAGRGLRGSWQRLPTVYISFFCVGLLLASADILQRVMRLGDPAPGPRALENMGKPTRNFVDDHNENVARVMSAIKPARVGARRPTSAHDVAHEQLHLTDALRRDRGGPSRHDYAASNRAASFGKWQVNPGGSSSSKAHGKALPRLGGTIAERTAEARPHAADSNEHQGEQQSSAHGVPASAVTGNSISSTEGYTPTSDDHDDLFADRAPDRMHETRGMTHPEKPRASPESADAGRGVTYPPGSGKRQREVEPSAGAEGLREHEEQSAYEDLPREGGAARRGATPQHARAVPGAHRIVSRGSERVEGNPLLLLGVSLAVGYAVHRGWLFRDDSEEQD
ncbi:unnamed protein product [Amoebophrya sp. A120]|nr:unnamed protein product [Amoebophrya sp. A120]|eukprot:GSA120T00015280001.1